MKKYKDEFEFARRHEQSVCDLLSREYHKKFETVYPSVKHSMDYAFYIGIPLFVIWMIWSSTTSFSEYYIAGILILFGLLVRWHCKFIAKLTLKCLFAETTVRLIDEYIEKLAASDIEADPESEAAIRKFYRSCRTLLISTVNVNIHKKPKDRKDC